MKLITLSESILFSLGPLDITQSVLTTWVLMFVLGGVSWASTRRLKTQPSTYQAALEGIVLVFEDAIEALLPKHIVLILPFLGTLWIFVLLANLTGLIPGLNSPTANLSVTSALAIVVFLSVHWFGIRADGLRLYLRHYLLPSPLLLPFHLISEVSRTMALAFRLFGNVMSLEVAALLVLMIAGFLVPIPLLMLHVVEALIQAYLFGMLALIYIAGGIQSQELRRKIHE